MQDPKFEKRVQRMMVELKFSPSPDVWDRVEAEINRDQKKKRFILWWIFFGLLISIGISYKYLRPSSQYFSGWTGQKVAFNSSGKKIASESPIASVKRERIYPAPSLRKETSTKSNALGLLARPIPIPKIKMQPRLGIAANTNQFHSRPVTRAVNTPVQGVIKKAAESPISSSIQNGDGMDTLLNQKKSGLAPTHETTDTLVKGSAGNYASNSLPLKFSRTDTAQGQAQKTGKLSRKLKLTPGYLATGNLSGLYSYSKNRLAQSSAPSTIYSNVPPSNSSRTSTYGTNNGFSFTAGIFIKESISKRLKISLGLNYHFYSTRIKTGQAVDTTLPIYNLNTQVSQTNVYYIPGITHSYANRFHFLELPLLMEMQLLKIRKSSLVAEGGLLTSYLMQTNSLYYDPYANIYYINKKVFHHWGLEGNVAFLYKFRYRNQVFQIGPQCQFGITGLLNHTTNYQEKLGSAGIKFTMNPFRK